MKNIVFAIFCILSFSILANGQCLENFNGQNSQQEMLEKFDNTLKNSIPAYAKFDLDGFFVYDLTQPANKYVSTQDDKTGNCLDFIDNHIYHFSPLDLRFAQSHIAFIRNGNLKVFEKVNCESQNDNLEKVVSYANEWLKNNDNKNEILTRLKNYRRYGTYFTIDDYRVGCNYDKRIAENSDELYNRWKVLKQLSGVLRSSVSEKIQDQLSWRFLVEESRANGFFVWDLTEPTNKQTSLLERVEFKNNHIYHFAFIDSPFSFSNIAVLEDGKLKIFKVINCEGKGDSLEDVVAYLDEKLRGDKNKEEIINRVKNYRKYGVYASFDGFSTPQCEAAVKIEK